MAWAAATCEDERIAKKAMEILKEEITKIDWNSLHLSYAFVAESALIFEHAALLTENTDKRNSYSYSDLYRIENTGNIGELKPSFRMHNHPDY